MKPVTRVLIVGGGFGGIKTALELAATRRDDLHIRLVSNTPHFEYHGALYRLVAGNSPQEVCIPLETIFANSPVEVVQDTLVAIKPNTQTVDGQDCRYRYDVLVIALGSTTSFYHTKGLKRYAYGFKSIAQALKLKRHLHQGFSTCALTQDTQDKICNTHIVIVGGGASGTELAGELALYTKRLAQHHHIDPSLITIDLIQSPNRLLPELPKDMSKNIETRLRKLGVNIYLNRRVVKEDIDTVYLKDMKLSSKTLVWTAGVRANQLVDPNTHTQLDWKTNSKGQVIVDNYLRVPQYPEIYAVGDVAAIKDSGMAQSALSQACYVAKQILNLSASQTNTKPYQPIRPIYAIPVGPGWAAVWIRGLKIYGALGWMLRRYLDWVVFTSLLPITKAWKAFYAHGKLCETCPECTQSNSLK